MASDLLKRALEENSLTSGFLNSKYVFEDEVSEYMQQSNLNTSDKSMSMEDQSGKVTESVNDRTQVLYADSRSEMMMDDIEGNVSEQR